MGTKTKKQVRYLLSDGSPLSKLEKEKLRRELRKGKVKIVPRKSLGGSHGP